MQKELNKKLKVDQINWVDVIKGLEGKTTFNSHDIKRALKTTGRSFNNNGPFHSVVKEFITALGKTVKSTLSSGEVFYTITSTEDALKAVDRRSNIKKLKPGMVGIGASALSAIGGAMCIKNHKPETSTAPTPTTSDEDKIRDLFKRSYTTLQHYMCLLAVLIKHGETKLSGDIIKTELSDLGINWTTFKHESKPVISEISKRLGFNTLVVEKVGPRPGIWKLEGTKDLLDEYTRLCDIYEKLSGKKPENLDDYIVTKASKAEVERKYEILKEIEELKKRTPHNPRTEKNQEIIWKKWLLISSSKNCLGASRSVASHITWIKSQRHFEIDVEEAKNLYREMMEDTERELTLSPQDYVSMTETAWKSLSKHYSPRNIKETILIKLPISPEGVSNFFQGLKFKLDETTVSGMYLYTVDIDRSVSCEIALKKLLRFIQISGKLYTENSWMVNRVMNIISKEDSDERAKNVLLLGIEEKI